VRLETLSALSTFTHRKYPWYSFQLQADSTSEPREAGRIKSMKNSNDTIGNRTRLPASSAVPQSTAPQSVPVIIVVTIIVVTIIAVTIM
jgi:hypothetical protein